MSDLSNPLQIAILDLYEGEANQGMRCLREIIQSWSLTNSIPFKITEFDVRRGLILPDLSFDLYLSSGGPGSPLSSISSEWDKNYLDWLNNMVHWNQTERIKKPVFLICHSFQLACRHFQLGVVCKRKSTAFGVFPIHMSSQGLQDPIFKGLKDPFYTVDSRDFQVIEPNLENIEKMGGQILAFEKIRPHVPYERAVMAIKLNDYMIGTQFHPEADAEGMYMYLQRFDKKQTVIKNHGEEKWKSMVEQLQDPEKIQLTYAQILPNFLSQALALRGI